MKQLQINKAYGALNKLANMQMPVRDAYNLYLLTEQIKPSYNFALEQEKKLLEKYGGVLDQNTGAFMFKDRETTDAFRQEITELNNLDVETEVDPVEISMDALGTQKITPVDIMCLEGFVAFV